MRTIKAALAVAVAFSGACHTTAPATPGDESPAAKIAVERLQERFRLALPKATREVAAPSHPVLEASPVDRFEIDHDALRPSLHEAPKGTARKAELRLPTHADAPFKLTDPESGVSIDVQLVGAAPIKAETASGFAAYPGAYHGGDVLHRPTVEGSEDYIWFEQAPEHAGVTYDVRLGDKVAGLRLVANVLEFLDARGAPRLRVSPPYLIGADGRRQTATLRVEGCAFDASPLAPWDRPVTRPNADHCTVEVDWSHAGAIAFPAVLDPYWGTTASLAVGRYLHAAVQLVSGKVLIAGGVDYNSQTSLASTELYDPSTNTCAAIGSFNPRDSYTLTLLADGRVLAAGGTNSGTTLRTADIYDPAVGWYAATNMASARASHSATLLPNGRVLIAGGAGAEYFAELFNPSANKFIVTGGLIGGRAKHVAALIGGKVLVAGGALNGAAQASAEIYDPTAGTWAVTGSLNQGRYNAFGTVLKTGLVLIAGGDVGGQTSSAESYNPSTGRWTVTGSMSSPRSAAAIGLLSSGTVLVAGGYWSSAGGLAATEIYLPGAGIWFSGGNMSTARYSTSGTVIGDGKVVVAGGYGASASTTLDVSFVPQTCGVNTDCISGFCTYGYCCNTPCNGGACDRCDLSGTQGICTTVPAGGDGNPTCSPLVCNGSSTSCPASCSVDTDCIGGYFCSGGSCLQKFTQGTACGANNQCGNGFCSDGYCCSSACSGGCDACSVALGASFNGTCTVLPNNSAGNPTCSPYVCNGVASFCPGTCTADANCVPGDYCNSSGHCAAKGAQGTACTANNQCGNSNCSDNYCCSSACSGGCDVCSAALGAGANGVCTVAAKGASDTSPACAPFACDGSGVSCPSTCGVDSDCASNAYCGGGTCKFKQGQGAGCTATDQCTSGFCSNSVCCNVACAGACDACSTAAGATTNGTCSVLPLGATGAPSCAPLVCTGSSASCPGNCAADSQCVSDHYCASGTCTPKLAQGKACSTSNQCLGGACSDGLCCSSACGGSCDVCAVALGASADGTCTLLSSTSAGQPSCGVYLCSGSAATCPSACGSDANCIGGDYCNTSGQCVPQIAQGGACSTSHQCHTGSCSDGVCCNSACDGSCDVCSVTLGASANGTCTLLPHGSAGFTCTPNACTGASASCGTGCAVDGDCAPTAYCSSGACVLKQSQGASCAASDQCLSGACADGFCCSSACGGACDVCAASLGASGNGACTILGAGAGGTPSCTPYLCGGSASCPVTCTSDSQCIDGDFCDLTTNHCVLKKATGTTCSRATMCLSKSCADGYCCDTACASGCDTCNQPGALGTCSVAPQGTTGSPSCGTFVCDGQSASCPSSCSSQLQCPAGTYCGGGSCLAQLTNGAACSTSGQCLFGNCVDNFCCNSACGGGCDVCAKSLGATNNGACTVLPASSPGTCGAYACSGSSASCPTTCAADNQCNALDYCDATGHCAPNQALGATCDHDRQCNSNHCADGVCCSSACSGACDFCSVAHGSGTDGICTGVSGSVGSPSCAPFLCSGAASCPATCTGDSQCSTGAYCAANQTCQYTQTNGAICARDGQCQSSHCADGFCCNSACGGSCDSCAASLGASRNGTCTTVAAGSLGTPSCAPYTCDGTSTSCDPACNADTDCASGNYCTSSHLCVAAQPNGLQCTRDRQCGTGHCADGFCCNSACGGSCDFCAASLGASGNGTCTNVAGAAGAPSCNLYVCQAATASCPGSCANDAQCSASAYCSNGACVAKRVNGTQCNATDQCSSGSCVEGVCCNTACSGACDTCLALLGASADGACTTSPAGAVGSPSCNPFVCDGASTTCPGTCKLDSDCISSAYCSSGACLAKRAIAVSCTASNQCSSNFCADGVCCVSACDGACDSCNLPGTRGTCSADPAGQPGDPSCGAYVCDGATTTCPASCTRESQCSAGNTCVNKSCQPKVPNGQACSTSQLCQSGSCVDGVCCDKPCGGGCDVCSASLGASSDGTCTVLPAGAAGPASSCGTYTCDGASAGCPTSCNSDANCVTGDFCNAARRCVPRQLDGSACTSTDQCGSGFCVDGVCCDTACTDQCASCNLAPSAGTCTPTKGQPMGSRQSCLNSGTTCGGLCDGVHTATCAFAGTSTVCSAAKCNVANESLAAALCDGTGACQPSSPVACGAFACVAGQCLGSCQSDADCIDGHVCDGGACIQKRTQGQVCTKNSVCTTGSCVSGFCCESACSGSCARCDTAGMEGLCLPIPAGTAPENGDCAPFVCNGADVSCPTQCSTSMDCDHGLVCTSGSCAPVKALGGTCTAADQCASGNCVDGFCCNSSCEGSCTSCAAPGHEGQCSFTAGVPAAGRTACAGTGVCGGVCDGTQAACTLPRSGTSCRPAFCSDGIAEAEATCDGKGTCSPGTDSACVAGCAADHCAPPPPVRSGGCASTESTGVAGLLLLECWRRRRIARRGTTGA
jgi:hypothetical protein